MDKKDDKKTKKAPVVMTARVLGADSKKALTGLFIAFKLKSAATGTAGDVLRVIEAAKDPGEQGKRKKKEYDRLVKEYEEQSKETPPEPADRYVLGIVDDKGFLQPVHENGNPWRDVATGRDPDTYKLAAKEKYQALYIRHPSPDVARALTRKLNGGTARDDIDLTDEKLWGKSAPALQEFEVLEESGDDGQQFVIKLPEKADKYVPRGSSDHGGWLLYAHMPHAHVEDVRKAVKSVASTLIELRYPATGTESPWKLDDELQWEFHTNIQAIIAMFQHHTTVGPFKPMDFAAAQGLDSWASVVGEDLPKKAEAKVSRLERIGIVGQETAARLKAWKTNEWMKPLPHLCRPEQAEYLINPAALAFMAWSSLAKVLGCDYGMKSGHSFRAVTAKGGGGAVETSNHKLGLAADMTGGRRRNTKEAWPVRFEAEWRVKGQESRESDLEKKKRASDKAQDRVKQAEKKLEKARKEQADLEAESPPAKKSKIDKAKGKVTAADRELKTAQIKARDAADAAAKAAEKAIKPRKDKARTDDHWSLYFRVYGHSTLEVFNKDKLESEIDDAKAGIAKWAGLPPPAKGTAAAGIRSMKDMLKKGSGGIDYLKAISGSAVDDWIEDNIEPFVKFGKELMRLDAATIVDRYFRDSVTQYTVNFYELEGGSDGKTYLPHEGDDDFPKREDAKSWLNLTALGFDCHMHRIPAHSKETRDQLARQDTKKPPRLARYEMQEAYMPYADSPAEAADIAAAIEDITADPDAATDLVEGEFPIKVYRSKKDEEPFRELTPSEIDGKFFKDWRAALSSFDAPVFAQLSKKKKKKKANKKAGKAAIVPLGAQMVLALNAVDPANEEALRKAIEELRGTFKDKNFVALKVGSLLEEDILAEVALTGQELGDWTEEAMVRLKDEALAEVKRKADEEAAAEAAEAKAEAEKEAAEAAANPKKKKKPKKKPKKKKKDIEAKLPGSAEDWTVLVQPIFEFEAPIYEDIIFLPGQIITLPPRENAAHLEWWHFEHDRSRSNSWGENARELGFSAEVLSTPKAGNTDPTGEPVHRGAGYGLGKAGNVPKVRPSNRDDEGTEDLDPEEPQQLIIEQEEPTPTQSPPEGPPGGIQGTLGNDVAPQQNIPPPPPPKS